MNMRSDDINLDAALQRFISVCRNAGLKVTHQRTEIFRQLVLLPDHPTVEMLHKRLLPALPSMSLDTVYRTLATLEQHGLVARIQTTESQARYEAVCLPHHHLICNRCRQVLDFQWPDIETLKLPDTITTWGQVDSKNVVIYGTCSFCLRN